MLNFRISWYLKNHTQKDVHNMFFKLESFKNSYYTQTGFSILRYRFNRVCSLRGLWKIPLRLTHHKKFSPIYNHFPIIGYKMETLPSYIDSVQVIDICFDCQNQVRSRSLAIQQSRGENDRKWTFVRAVVDQAPDQEYKKII